MTDCIYWYILSVFSDMIVHIPTIPRNKSYYTFHSQQNVMLIHCSFTNVEQHVCIQYFINCTFSFFYLYVLSCRILRARLVQSLSQRMVSTSERRLLWVTKRWKRKPCFLMCRQRTSRLLWTFPLLLGARLKALRDTYLCRKLLKSTRYEPQK